jgi:hypothetical protein
VNTGNLDWTGMRNIASGLPEGCEKLRGIASELDSAEAASDFWAFGAD